MAASEALFVAQIVLLLLVGRLAGETLFFGKVAAAVIEHAECSICLVSS